MRGSDEATQSEGSSSRAEHAIADAQEWRASLRELGTTLGPELLEGTKRLCASALDSDYMAKVEVVKDAVYGPHERHRFDVYVSARGQRGGSALPALLFVHGGGFVAGDKGGGENPFGPNIGAWAAKNGMVGLTMNYRLAPEATWPSGSEDIASAVRHIQVNASLYGIDPNRIVLFGQSAGATHVADYLRLIAPESRPAVAGAVLVSCLYDVGSAEYLPIHRAYWGDDRSEWPEKDAVESIVDSDVPLLLVVAEWDEAQFHRSATTLTKCWFERRETFPPLVMLPSQNHLSTVYAVGTRFDKLTRHISEFVAERIA